MFISLCVFKVIILIRMSALVKKIAPRGVVMCLSALAAIISQELIELSLCFMGVAKPFTVISFWVFGVMIYRSIPIKVTHSKELVFCFIFLALFTVMSLTAKNFLSFYFLLEATLIPTVFIIYV